MSGNVYTRISIDENYERYDFVSEGKRFLKKTVRFNLINEKEQIYNLALCTVLPGGELDCENSSRNGDMNTVLETVAHIARMFSDRYPHRKIFLMGSDVFRTRQYQIKIALFHELINSLFVVEGVTMNGFHPESKEIFKTGINYDAFLLTRKRE